MSVREQDRVVLAVVGVLALALYGWLALGLAALLLSGRWVALSPPEALIALVGMLLHPSAPARALPAPARAQEPGGLWLYAALWAPALLAGGLYLRLRRGPQAGRWARATQALRTLALLEEHAYSTSRGARWARARELAPLAIAAPEPGRLSLGYSAGQLLAAERGHSVAVIGPTQSGKTSGLAIPALLEWEGPVLATSVKADLHEHTAAWRASCGPVWIYDPTGTQSAFWNPLEGVGDWRDALRMAHWLTSAANSAPGKGEEGRFWTVSAEKLLAPALLAAAIPGMSMEQVLRWLNLREIEEVAEILLDAGQRAAWEAWQASVSRDERTLSSIIATAETVLAAYQDPAVLRSALGRGIEAEQLLRGGTLYICAPLQEQERLAPLFSALVRQVVTAAYDRYAATGHPLDPPLLLLLDEAGNIAPIPDLAQIAATGAAIGVQVVSVWHDISQMQRVYGRQGAETTLNNHRATLVLPGISDEQTLQWVDRTLGQQAVKRRQVTRGKARSESESESWHPLAPAPLTRQQRIGEAILVYGHLPPARLRLRRYFAERVLRARALAEQEAVRR